MNYAVIARVEVVLVDGIEILHSIIT